MKEILFDKEYNTPHIVHEAMCLKCLHRWIECRPEGTWLKDLECPHCERKGFIIATGQEMEEEN